MNIKVNLKSVIKYEQYTNKSFSSINYNDEEDVLNFLYCIILANNDEVMTFEKFIEILKDGKRLSDEIKNKWIGQMKLFELFSDKNNQHDESIENDNIIVPETDIKEIYYFKDRIAELIVSGGIDANYVMNEMSLTDFKLFWDAYYNKYKEQRENDRRWCYYSIVPHLGSDSKLTSPTKFFPFAWEEETIIKELKQVQEKDKLIEENMSTIFENSKQFIDIINKNNEQNNI